MKACVLKRPRHEHIIKDLEKMNVKINFITDGDIAGALSVIGNNQLTTYIIAQEELLKV